MPFERGPALRGELMLEAQVRIVTLIERVARELPDQAVVLVSHGDLVRSAILYYLGMPIEHYKYIEISPASISTLVVGEKGPQLLLLNSSV